MKAPTIASRVLIVLLSTVALVLSGTLAWAAVSDFQSRGLVPEGVNIAGTSLGGMTETSARAAIETAVSAPLLRPVDVQVEGKVFTLDPKNIVTVDVDGMISDAYSPRREAPFVQRLRDKYSEQPPATNIDPQFTIADDALAAWVASIAKQTNRRATDADMQLEDGAVVITKSVTGRRLDASSTLAAVSAALTSDAALASAGRRSVSAIVHDVKPHVTEANFGKAIVVDVSERKIRLYNDMKLEKAYGCAVGTPQFPTPKGAFKIVQRRYLPTWRNPGSEWAKDMPAFIGPGPDNPLGTRALNLNVSGIRIHGTSQDFSIGSAASHGCMRMHMWDIEDLYPRVPVGTPIFIVR